MSLYLTYLPPVVDGALPAIYDPTLTQFLTDYPEAIITTQGAINLLLIVAGIIGALIGVLAYAVAHKIARKNVSALAEN